jgi:hypothetical protein
MSDSTVVLARTAEELEQLRPTWDAVAWTRADAEYDHLVADLQTRPGAPGAFALLVQRSGRVAAALAGRVESTRLRSRFGYLTLFAPRVRLLQAVPGGVVADDAAAAHELADAVAGVLRSGEVDAVSLPALPVHSDAYRAFAAVGGPLERERFTPSWTRHLLVLPPTFEEFLASRSGRLRGRVRNYGRRLVKALDGEVSVEVLQRPDQLERLVRDVDAVARLTYQRAVGSGFGDTPRERRLAEIGLAHGWLRAWVLYHRERPIAYWLCGVHRDTILLKTTGYDPAYAEHRPGTYLLLRVIEDACADPQLRVLDFGPGRSPYKQLFGNESYEERNLVVFAPTVRGRSIALVRAATLGLARLARGVLDATRLTARVKTAWRRHLRSGDDRRAEA